jgi:hypothetical protein
VGTARKETVSARPAVIIAPRGSKPRTTCNVPVSWARFLGQRFEEGLEVGRGREDGLAVVAPVEGMIDQAISERSR